LVRVENTPEGNSGPLPPGRLGRQIFVLADQHAVQHRSAIQQGGVG
jgi:hypothetical protein